MHPPFQLLRVIIRAAITVTPINRATIAITVHNTKVTNANRVIAIIEIISNEIIIIMDTDIAAGIR